MKSSNENEERKESPAEREKGSIVVVPESGRKNTYIFKPPEGWQFDPGFKMPAGGSLPEIHPDGSIRLVAMSEAHLRYSTQMLEQALIEKDIPTNESKQLANNIVVTTQGAHEAKPAEPAPSDKEAVDAVVGTVPAIAGQSQGEAGSQEPSSDVEKEGEVVKLPPKNWGEVMQAKEAEKLKIDTSEAESAKKWKDGAKQALDALVKNGSMTSEEAEKIRQEIDAQPNSRTGMLEVRAILERYAAARKGPSAIGAGTSGAKESEEDKADPPVLAGAAPTNADTDPARKPGLDAAAEKRKARLLNVIEKYRRGGQLTDEQAAQFASRINAGEDLNVIQAELSALVNSAGGSSGAPLVTPVSTPTPGDADPSVVTNPELEARLKQTEEDLKKAREKIGALESEVEGTKEKLREEKELREALQGRFDALDKEFKDLKENQKGVLGKLWDGYKKLPWYWKVGAGAGLAVFGSAAGAGTAAGSLAALALFGMRIAGSVAAGEGVYRSVYNKQLKQLKDAWGPKDAEQEGMIDRMARRRAFLAGGGTFIGVFLLSQALADAFGGGSKEYAGGYAGDVSSGAEGMHASLAEDPRMLKEVIDSYALHNEPYMIRLHDAAQFHWDAAHRFAAEGNFAAADQAYERAAAVAAQLEGVEMRLDIASARDGFPESMYGHSDEGIRHSALDARDGWTRAEMYAERGDIMEGHFMYEGANGQAADAMMRGEAAGHVGPAPMNTPGTESLLRGGELGGPSLVDAYEPDPALSGGEGASDISGGEGMSEMDGGEAMDQLAGIPDSPYPDIPYVLPDGQNGFDYAVKEALFTKDSAFTEGLNAANASGYISYGMSMDAKVQEQLVAAMQATIIDNPNLLDTLAPSAAIGGGEIVAEGGTEFNFATFFEDSQAREKLAATIFNKYPEHAGAFFGYNLESIKGALDTIGEQYEGARLAAANAARA